MSSKKKSSRKQLEEQSISPKADHTNLAKKKKSEVRLDQWLLDHGYVSSLKESQALVMAGKIIINSQIARFSSQKVGEKAEVEIKSEKRQFVSRAGEKLFGFIKECGLSDGFNDKIVLDIGSSTGGFTDCVLRLGAEKVIALDVGYNQLHWSLRSNDKVICRERTDVRVYAEERPESDPTPHWLLADISFNSLARLAPAICRLINPNSQVILLVKPQFELDREKIPEGGVVTDPDSISLAVNIVREAFESIGVNVLNVKNSVVKGKKGNQEVFVHLRPYSQEK